MQPRQSEQWSSCSCAKLSDEGTQTPFLFSQARAGQAQPPHEHSGTQHRLGTPQWLLTTYRNLYFPATQGTAGIPSPAGATSQQGLHSHPLFLSKLIQGGSPAPQPAELVYQLSHPDLQIIHEPAAPTSSWGRGGTYLQ